MQFYYGEKMPLRLLDEVEFWNARNRSVPSCSSKSSVWLSSPRTKAKSSFYCCLSR